ncbi:protein-disulfide reductase DsbD [Haemophilus paracuniculus]|uniref:Thiol:disulfide interchange protein DsbD n=1 Tax=Haemophilus paracuniculus TaxID=734 RepID=A0A1T0AT69_9PAST|nr:protein-disulfide reductase DsbD [Haemophilus paracuniculus]OOR99806.1 protein-disulfide reductase DsbD [Haemophilus paracuniculus]
MWKRFFALWLGLLIAVPLQAGLFDNKPKYLPSQVAFAFSAQQQGSQIALDWQIADGYYLYKKEIQIKGLASQVAQPIFPPSIKHNDEFFGEVEIYRNQLALNVPIEQASENASLEVRYQGCTKGFCYPPETVSVPISAKKLAEPTASSPSNAQPNGSQNQLASQLSNNGFSVVWFFVLGLGLAFTPCVLPMLPLLSAIVIGKQQRPNPRRALLLSLCYVQGMAITYTLMGFVVVALGLPFQIALQSPPVLLTMAALFVLLSLSMFGLFELKLPNAWQQKLNALSQQQQGGSIKSVFLMGMIAGLIASPCTTAPLSGALLYVAQSGDLLTGGLALYLLALGMGLPLVLITLFGNQILPKSGAWLLNVKTAFGFVMLALPVFLISRVYPAYEPYLWSALALAFLAWLIAIMPANKLGQAVRLGLLFAFAISAKPYVDWIFQTQKIEQKAPLARIFTLAELDQKLLASQGKKVMLDLYADWCVACKEFEKYTFTDPNVKNKMAEMVVLQVDMTQNSPSNTAFMQKFQVLGLPTILFFDENGKELTEKRVTGFLDANAFYDWLNNL